MMIATTVLLVLLFAGAAFATLLLVRWFLRGQGQTGARLHDPGVPTVVHTVPLGVDAAKLEAALGHAGFTSMVEAGARSEQLVIECAPEDRERVRGIIDEVYAKEYGAGAGLHLGPATFLDEQH